MFSESVLAGLPFPSRVVLQGYFALENVSERLNTVSSHCARGKSFIARKPEVHSKILSGKNF